MSNFWLEGRYFGERKDNILIIIPHWGAINLPYNLLAAMLARDFYVKVYHYPHNLLTADLGGTIKNMGMLEDIILNELEETAYPSLIGIYGVSLGSVPAVRIANTVAGRSHIRLRLAISMSGASFPQAVWYGHSTRHLRKELESKGVTARDLCDKWDFFSPVNNLNFLHLRQTPILFFGSLGDQTITPLNVSVMAYVLRHEYSPAIVCLNRFLGHRSGGIMSMLRIPLLRSFLLRENGDRLFRSG